MTIIRKAMPVEAPVCATVLTCARAEMEYLPQDLHTTEETQAWMQQVVFAHQSVWVAEIKGVIAGFISFDQGEVHNLFVLPQYQNQNLGRDLLQHAQRQAKQDLALWVFEQNTRAIGFYHRHGFEICENAPSGENEEGLPDKRMTWKCPTDPQLD